MSEFKTLLPINATEAERAVEQTAGRIESIGVPLRDLWNPAKCSEKFLPWLAWAFHVDNWDDEATETQKRSLIANAFNLHRVKGTPAALKAALSPLGYAVTIEEWFQNAGMPCTFELFVDVGGKAVTPELFTQIEAVIDKSKNVRSHFTGTKLIAATTCRMNTILSTGTEADLVEIRPFYEIQKEYTLVSSGAYGGAFYIYDEITLKETV